MRVLEVLGQLPLVLLQPLLELLILTFILIFVINIFNRYLFIFLYLADDGGAVARRALRDRPLLDVARQVEEVLLPLLERLLGQRRRVRIRELLRVGVVVAAVGGPLRRLVVLEGEKKVLSQCESI